MWIVSAMLIMAVVLFCFGAIGVTGAQFTGQDPSSDNVLRAASFPDFLSLSPGTSEGSRGLIAQTDGEGNIVLLDYGEVEINVRYRFKDVFRIENISDSALEVKVEFSPEVAGFFEKVELNVGKHKGNPLTLNPGEEAKVKTELKIPAGTAPGDYNGKIFISAEDGFLMDGFPVLITVI